MNDPAHPPTFERPFPALTPEQRYHFEVYGYTVVEHTLQPDEVRECKDAVYRIREELLKLEDPSMNGPRYHGAYLAKSQPHHHFLGHILESEPAVTAYATHPRLVAMAEEIMGGEARIVEVNAHINSVIPDADFSQEPTYGFHKGADVPFGSHVMNGLIHCSFVKTLTNLTDLGPDDGGPVVVAGSHKVDVPSDQLIEAAYSNRSLIHQVVAPAGSTLLFAETLIHATGQIRSDTERVILIAGYGTTLYPYWDNGILSEEFENQIPDHMRTLFKGKVHWTRNPRYRTLDQAEDDRDFNLGKWDDRRRVEKQKPEETGKK
ncbi:MAG: phytanoyl-CoA dioxygenase family protein [Planctomycetota bacterium]|nr:phytanoyl-CoA dioxygenase family protein [Planctomycetota bacterium]